VKRALLVSLIVLTAASVALYRTLPENRGPAPVLNWVTDDDPVRRETIALFGKWLADNHLPPVDLRVDTANLDVLPSGASKELVQGVSGVGDDLIDVYTNQLELFQATGMLADLTETAPRHGFGPDKTYGNLKSDFMIAGRQYGFPRNADTAMLWVNRDTFARYGVPEPPSRWNWDQFETLGRRFVAAANPPGTRKRIYFLNRVWLPVLRRGTGLSEFNETMTRCILDDPRNVEVMRRLYRWTVVDRLMPTLQEQYALVTDASLYQSNFSLFAGGRFAMMYEGLWALIRLRPRGDFNMRVIEPFNSGFPNVDFGCGEVGIYAGSKHREEACRFLEFLTSEPYNLMVARSGDSLPPIPAYAATPAFLHPNDKPGERGIQEAFAKAIREIGIAETKSPFALPSVAFRIEMEENESMLAGRITPEEEARHCAQRVNDEITLNLRQDAGLRRFYDGQVAIQAKIDALRAAGKPVPASWITNPFHLAYYKAKGWLAKEP
jgi:multiple sugar transport system substrate-binding protein